ncbi:MAG TPA: fasciclin domain-containing protein [Nocardioides sp.]|nr:fasciclin domain-containing protein [Nocardioides sp.]
MRHTRTSRAVAAGLTAAALATTGLVAAPAQAAPGTTSLAEVLAADGNRLDGNWDDFDIVEKAVYAVLDAKPDSPVAVLADGDTALTAFVPTDRAFRRLVHDLTGERKARERGVLRAVTAFADADTLESVLLYHVVPGSTITYHQAKQADGARLTTALGSKIGVNVVDHGVRLRDRDRDDRNPRVVRALKNVNKGNEQIAHGINRVLRPLDL